VFTKNGNYSVLPAGSTVLADC